MGACTLKAVDAGLIGHEDRIGAADEKAALHHTDDTPDAVLQSCRIVDAAEIAIKNEVTAVGDKGRDRRYAGASAGAEHFERLAGSFQSEGDHFYRKRCLCTKSVHHLAAVDDDREAMARGCDNLLAQQRSA